MWVAHDEAAEGASVTQASKWAVESRFYPMGNEEPLKDFKQECDLLILLFWKELSCSRDGVPGSPMMATSPELPTGLPSLLAAHHLHHPAVCCWPAPHRG